MVKMQNVVITIQTDFIVHVKTDDIYKKIAENDKTKFGHLKFWNRQTITCKEKK